MAEDANQIARQFERRQQQAAPPVFATGALPPKPTVGEFTVMSSFADTAYVLATFKRVTVNVGPSGIILLTHDNGGKTMFKPVDGWCMIFEPDDAEG